jgi:putative acetyltransferase
MSRLDSGRAQCEIARMDTMSIRPATADDARGILEAHRAAVLGSGRIAYPADILEAWAAVIDPVSVQQLADRIATRAELVVVADAGGAIAGFGSIDPQTSELLAVYVIPHFGRRGIGAQIVASLEELAQRSQLGHLSLDASLNSETFYIKHGYTSLERGGHRLRSGARMACVRMRKVLNPGSQLRD